MDKLFFMRLSDRPEDVLSYSRRNGTETVIRFSLNNREFCYTKGVNSSFGWIGELAKYDKLTACNHKAAYGNPGGYARPRLRKVWPVSFRYTINKFVS